MSEELRMKAMGKLKEQVWPVISDIKTYGRKDIDGSFVRRSGNISQVLKYRGPRSYTLSLSEMASPYRRMELGREGPRHTFRYSASGVNIEYFPNTKYIRIDNLVLSLGHKEPKPEDLPEGPLKDYVLLLKEYALEPERMIMRGFPGPRPYDEIPAMSHYQRIYLKNYPDVEFIVAEGTLLEPQYVRLYDGYLDITYIPDTFRVTLGDRKVVVRNGEILVSEGTWDTDALKQILRKGVLLSVGDPHLWEKVLLAARDLTVDEIREKYGENFRIEVNNTSFHYEFTDEGYQYTKTPVERISYEEDIVLDYQQLDGGYGASITITEYTNQYDKELRGISYDSGEGTLTVYRQYGTVRGPLTSQPEIVVQQGEPLPVGFMDLEQYRQLLQDQDALQQAYPF